MKSLVLLLILTYFIAINGAIADEDNKKNNDTTLTFNETMETEVTPDRIYSVLSFIVKDKNVTKAQKKLNSKMAKAVDIAQKVEGIKISTHNYRTNEEFSYQKIYEMGKTINKRVSDGWKVSQDIKIKGGKIKDIMNTTLKLQQLGMKSSSIGFYLSKDLIRNTEKDLVSKIIYSVKDKVKNIQKDIGAKNYLIKQINLNKQNNYRNKRSYDMNFSKSEALSSMAAKSPTAIAEEQTIAVRANVTVIFEN